VVMVQELIPGGGETQFSYAGLLLDGHPLASVVARRARQYPMDFGRFSTFVELVDEPGVESTARRLLTAIRYTGLIEVEFKRDPRDGCYKLLDMNPRVWGWHTLGQRVGVDFPYLLWRLIQEQPVPETRGHRPARWVWLLPDLVTAAREVKRGSLSPYAYLRSLRPPLEFPFLALDDLLPALVGVSQLIQLACRWKEPGERRDRTDTKMAPAGP